MDDVVLDKAAAIERCVHLVHEEHAGDDGVRERDITKPDNGCFRPGTAPALHATRY
jgi:hypothetical protein